MLTATGSLVSQQVRLRSASMSWAGWRLQLTGQLPLLTHQQPLRSNCKLTSVRMQPTAAELWLAAPYLAAAAGAATVVAAAIAARTLCWPLRC